MTTSALSRSFRRGLVVALFAGVAACAQGKLVDGDDEGPIGGSGGDSGSAGTSVVAGAPGGAGMSAAGAPASGGSAGTVGTAGTSAAGSAGAKITGGSSAGGSSAQGGSAGTVGAAGSPMQGGSDPGGFAPTSCDDINGKAGCCYQNTNYYCASNKVSAKVCPDSCGWSKSKSYYDCGETGSDPSKDNPIVCAGAGSSGGGVIPTTCSAAQGGTGCCGPDGNVYYCASGDKKPSSKTCASGTCGWDPNGKAYGCDTSGKADPSGGNPIACGD